MTARALITLALPWMAAAPLPAQDGPVVIYVVRHAERLDDGVPAAEVMADPPLSAAGELRARELVEILRGAGLGRVHSTDYHRTRDTARPLADALGVEVEIYDTDDLGEIRHAPQGVTRDAPRRGTQQHEHRAGRRARRPVRGSHRDARVRPRVRRGRAAGRRHGLCRLPIREPLRASLRALEGGRRG
jgi:broad specificity phosphatase PhoE